MNHGEKNCDLLRKKGRDAVHRSAAALGVVRSARAELPQAQLAPWDGMGGPGLTSKN